MILPTTEITFLFCLKYHYFQLDREKGVESEMSYIIVELLYKLEMALINNNGIEAINIVTKQQPN